MQATVHAETRHIVYDDATARGFVFASVAWGLIGLLVGLLAALQLSFPALNLDIPFLTFSRIRPLHTNAVIFALVGNMMFAGIYYSTQRLLKTRMASDWLSKLHLWGWQLVIFGAALTLPFGITQSKEYAELEWFLDLLVVVVWVAFAANFFWTLAIRNERNLYVAIWFYISTVLTIAVLYIVNNLSLPFSATKSYGVFAGAQDALTQWWYGHNAVAFFLTTPILGIMYYFLPKAADRPVYSYRLSVIHFWALVFLYIWAGPHHLLYTALPDWAQTLGMTFSLMLWAPSWGGMLNGLLTLRGAWDKVRQDPVLKFYVAAVTFYGMSTFEGPLLSIKSVSALGHYTDWIIGHAHGGALGWNGLMAAGMFYWMVPRLFGTKLWSRQLADLHFWLAIVGILLYMGSMWISGITQGLMWRAETADGALQYPDWVETVRAINPMYITRSVGGAMFLTGWVLMIVNLVRTVRSGKAVDGEATVQALVADPAAPTTGQLIFSKPILVCVVGMAALVLFGVSGPVTAPMSVGLMLLIAAWSAALLWRWSGNVGKSWHHALEGRPLAFTVLVLVAVLAGGIFELVPGLVLKKEVPLGADGAPIVTPYTALELEGRDVYVREGCYVCHSQMIRPFRAEFLRYGEPSRIEESLYDHPFQWGSKRTGPDLAREGGRRDDVWHWLHMLTPTQISDGSIMPAYPWLEHGRIDPAQTPAKMRLMRKLGVPYTREQIQSGTEAYREQAQAIVANLAVQQITAHADSELVALIGYLQRLGRGGGIKVSDAK